MKRTMLTTVAFLLALDACTAAERTTARDILATAPVDIQAACRAALSAADLASGVVKGGAAGTVGEIAAGVVVGCTTADGIARLASDLSSVDWLGEQAGTLRTITAGQAASGT